MAKASGTITWEKGEEAFQVSLPISELGSRTNYSMYYLVFASNTTKTS